MSTAAEPVPAAEEPPVVPAPEGWGPRGTPDPLKDRHGLIGAPVSRVDGPAKVTGTARFAAEVVMGDILYAALAYSTVPKGRIATLDTEAAEAALGVALVMTHRNAPSLNLPPAFLASPMGTSGDNLPVMQDDLIRWNGQPIAIVLAETQEQADYARSLIRATYEVEPAITSFAEAKEQPLRRVPFLGGSLAFEKGDAEAALAAAPLTIDATYRTPFENHNAIELHGATLAWRGDELFVHDCVQGVVHEAATLAEIFGLQPERVHVSAPYVGGAFGGKAVSQHQIVAAAASRMVGRPVRVELSREGVYRIIGGRAVTEQRVAIGAQADGRLEALIHTGTTAMTKQNALSEPFVMTTQTLYASPNLKLDVEVADMDMLANTFMRAPGESVGSFALESAIDELAALLDMDPIELRIRNEPDTHPMTGLPFSMRHVVDAFRTGAERFGWSERNPQPRARRDGEWLIGMGCAGSTYPYVRLPGGAARITLTKDGRATVEIAAHEMGMGTATVHTQVAAERLGLPLDHVTFLYGDTKYPGVVLAAGHQQTASIGASVIAAQRALVAELLTLITPESALAGLAEDDVTTMDGGLCSLDDPRRSESYGFILAGAQLDEVSVQGDADTRFEAQGWAMHSYGAHFCEVRVNAITGETRVSRYLGSFDCGRILNVKTASSQIRGGIVMGIGMALMEETRLGEHDGRVVNPSLSEYHVPVHMDIPEIDVIWTDIPDPLAPMGALGVGEMGIIGAAGAIANAVYNATGSRIRDLPITLDKVLASWQ